MLGRPRPRPVPPGGRRRSGRGASAPRLCVGRRGVGQGGGANRDERVERQPHQRVGALPVGTAGLVGRHKQHPHHVCGAPRKGRRARSQDPRHQLFPEVRRRDGVREPLGGGGGRWRAAGFRRSNGNGQVCIRVPLQSGVAQQPGCSCSKYSVLLRARRRETPPPWLPGGWPGKEWARRGRDGLRPGRVTIVNAIPRRLGGRVGGRVGRLWQCNRLERRREQQPLVRPCK